MTAEIVIMNKEAVALACDSAVTARIANANKIFTSANKLFALTYQHPVGIMVYNSANFMEMPWETIIKSYRATSPERGFDTLEDYTDDFLSYLSNNELMFPKDGENRFVLNFVTGTFWQIQREVNDQVTAIISQIGKIDDTTTEKIVTATIDKHLTSWVMAASPDGSTTVEVGSNILSSRKQQVDEAINTIFQKLPISKKYRNKLFELAARVLATGVNNGTNSGVVIAGFGEKDYFPSIQYFTVEGIVDKLVRRSVKNTVKIDRDHPGQIIPFAQRDMVDRFMEGVDRSYRVLENTYVSDLCQEFTSKITDYFSKLEDAKKEELKIQLTTICDGLKQDFSKKVQSAIWNKFVAPVYSVISSLPKNELAVMAEALVSITSLKRQFSAEEETVKEPIDVAVISKWDGFIWIKRKHYFSSDLNPHYFTMGRSEAYESE